jgi:hypothetical protein
MSKEAEILDRIRASSLQEDAGSVRSAVSALVDKMQIGENDLSAIPSGLYSERGRAVTIAEAVQLVGETLLQARSPHVYLRNLDSLSKKTNP